jgi:FMN phosphatase YigB (HAD superfamily)
VAKNMIKAVLFDWDNTLAMILGKVSISEKIVKLLADQGFSYSTDDVSDAFHIRQKCVQVGILPGKSDPQTCQDILQFYMQLILILECPKANRAFAYRLYSEFGRLPVVFFDDTLIALQKLTEMGLTLGIISNIGKLARKTIEVNVKDFISPSHIIISEEVGVHKPTKTIFQLAASRLKTPPDNCLYVGDNLNTDAIGAVQQGGFGKGLWLDRKGKGIDIVLPERVRRISSLLEVINNVP